MTKIFNLKILIVFIVSVFVGLIIFKLTDNKIPHKQQIVTNKNKALDITPTPKPTLPPLNVNSNLEEELEKLTPKDFSEDFKKLREEVKNF